MAEIRFSFAIQGPDDFKLDYAVQIGITRIGRQPGNDIVLAHGQISRGHARLETTTTDCTITDLGSSNGTAVNGEKIEPNAPVSLKNGDQLKIGPFEIAVRAEEVEAPAVAEPPHPESDPSIVEEVVPAEEPPEEIKEEALSQPEEEEKPAPEVAAKKPAAKKSAAAKKKPAEKAPAEKEPAEKAPQAVKSRPPAGPPPASPPPSMHVNGRPELPPGLAYHSTRLLDYLPGIYHTDFMARFLGIFEATFLPIEWTMDHFDLFLDPDAAPADFLSWLGSWYGITFDSTWSDVQRRTLLKEAHAIFARRGTASALSRVLEIYTGVEPDIDDLDEKLEPFTFKVTIPLRKGDVRQDMIEALIDAHKPAHTNYRLAFKGS